MSELAQPPRCHTCAAVLTPPGQVCGACRAVQSVPPLTRVPLGKPKSPGLAAFLSFLWLGAGHLYAGSVGVGVALAIFDLFLVLMAFSLVGLIIAFPIWLVAVIIAMITSASAVTRANQAGHVVVPRL